MGPKRILLADDDAELRELLSFFLRKHGFEVVPVTNGREALAAAQEAPFDLALLDVMMPEIDGYHAAQRLSDLMGASRPKILLITSRDVQAEKGIALMSGADGSVQKPFKLADVLSAIRTILASAG